MHIMFVCTGNICRSPMGELLLTKYLNGTTVRVSSCLLYTSDAADE